MGRSKGGKIIDIVLVEEGGKHVKNPVSFSNTWGTKRNKKGGQTAAGHQKKPDKKHGQY